VLARRSLIIVLANLLGALGGLVALFAVGRYMGPGPFGMVGFSLSVVGLAGFLARLGLDTAHRKRISEGSDLGTCMGTYTWIKLGLLTLFGLLVFVAAWIWNRERGFVDATSYPVLLAMILYTVLLELRHVPIATYDGLLQSAKAQTVVLADHIVRTPFIVLAALLYGALTRKWTPLQGPALKIAAWLHLPLHPTVGDGALLLAGAYILGILAGTVTGWWLLLRDRIPFARFDGETARRYARFALPTAALTVAFTISLELDRFMIGFFWSAVDVGYYFAAQRILGVALLLPTAVATVFFPLISELAARGAMDGVREVLRTTLRALTLVMVFLAVLLAVFSQEGIRILQSARFDEAAPILAVLSLHGLVMAFFTVAHSTVLGFDRPRQAARIGIAMVAVNVLLNLIFIPSSLLGIPMLGLRGLGAAWATVLSQAVGTLFLLRATRQLSGMMPWSISTAKHFVVGALCAITLWLLKPLFNGADRFHELALMGVVAAGLYFGALALWGEVTRKDLILVADILHPGKLARHIRNEFSHDPDR
jgi:O-antigen/teichoic acid export membrane protein